MNRGKVVIGVLAGLAAGAAIGILFAPDKGTESRHKIAQKGEDYLDSVKRKFNSLLDSISGRYNGGKAEVGDLIESGQSTEAGKRMRTASSS